MKTCKIVWFIPNLALRTLGQFELSTSQISNKQKRCVVNRLTLRRVIGPYKIIHKVR